MENFAEHPTVKHFYEERTKRGEVAADRVLDAAWLRLLCLDAGADDVGFVERDRPEIADQKADIENVFPRTRTLISVVCRMNRENIRTPARSISNLEFHHTTDETNGVALRIVSALEEARIGAINGGAVGFPMEADRWGSKMWVISHKPVAVAAGLGQMGIHRNVIHPKFGISFSWEPYWWMQKSELGSRRKSLADSDVAAVVATSGISSGLTRDRAKLQDTIMKLRMGNIYGGVGRACPQMTYYEADRIMNKHDFMVLETAIENTLACCECKRDMAEVQAQNTASETLHVGDQDVHQTLGFIRDIVGKMAAMPGQRTLVLISAGILTVTPEAMAGKSAILDLAAKSNVTINALDARGLYTTNVDASEQSRGSSIAERNAAQYRGYSMTLNEDVMAELADGTGGTFFS